MRELFATNLRQELRDVLQPHGEAAGALAQKLVGAIDCGVDNAETTRARARRLEADGALRVAEPLGGGDEGAAPLSADERRHGHAGRQAA